MPPPDRLRLLADQNRLTGIDFVYVHESQTLIDVFFHVDPRFLEQPLAADFETGSVTIVDTLPGEEPFPIVDIDWPIVDDRQVLRLETPFAGGFQLYRLRLADPRIDPWFSEIEFSFKANCETWLDCRPPPHECPPGERIEIRPDYRARDFWALRAALMDFASERWPDWKDRLAADAGVTVAELFAALGDEFAYLQDRIAHETHLETALHRRSLRRHARLVDYEPHDGSAASGWLVVRVAEGESGDLPAGTLVLAPSDMGEPMPFEVGTTLAERVRVPAYPVTAAANELDPYIWDEDPPPGLPGEVGSLDPRWREGPPSCLPVGATEMWLDGHHAADLPLTDLPADPAAPPGRWVLLRTDPEDPSLPARRHPVRLIEVEDTVDPLPPGTRPLTRVRWEEAQALPFQLDLEALTVEGNLVPVTAGRTFEALFSAGVRHDGPALPRTVEREGPGGIVTHLLSLPGSDELPLARFGRDPRAAVPDIRLEEVAWNAALETWEAVDEWVWRRSLVGVNASLPEQRHFTLDDGLWRPVVSHWRREQDYDGWDHAGGRPRFESGRLVHYDLAVGDGATIRFGDGEFGRLPSEGTAFRAFYRLGGGRRGNVAADTIVEIAEGGPGFVEAIRNPLATAGGADAEEPRQVRRLAPELYRTLTFRAVAAPDYGEQAERLPWVQSAGSCFRWTGSWLSAFVTVDQAGARSLAPERAAELGVHLDRVRQTGREVVVRPPRYADVDLEITVCVAPGFFRGDVRARVMEALFVRPAGGFFSPDNFTFGTPLRRSALEAAIQSVEGVRAVKEILVRRRGWFDWRLFDGPYEPAADDEVIRLANDPTRPEKGMLDLKLEGGA